jgi:hypothetical protein
MNGQAGKGDRNRTSDWEAYRRNYERAFNTQEKPNELTPAPAITTVEGNTPAPTSVGTEGAGQDL